MQEIFLQLEPDVFYFLRFQPHFPEPVQALFSLRLQFFSFPVYLNLQKPQQSLCFLLVLFFFLFNTNPGFFSVSSAIFSRFSPYNFSRTTLLAFDIKISKTFYSTVFYYSNSNSTPHFGHFVISKVIFAPHSGQKYSSSSSCPGFSSSVFSESSSTNSTTSRTIEFTFSRSS